MRKLGSINPPDGVMGCGKVPAPPPEKLGCCYFVCRHCRVRRLAAYARSVGDSSVSSSGLCSLFTITIRYDSVYLTCTKKLTDSQPSPPHGKLEYYVYDTENWVRGCSRSTENGAVR